MRLQRPARLFVACLELPQPHDLLLDQRLLFLDRLLPDAHLPVALDVGQLLRLDERLLVLVELLGDRLEPLQLPLEPLQALLEHRDARGRGLRPLQQLGVLALNLRDALVVGRALLDHVGQAAGALVQVLGDVVDRHPLRQGHLAQPLIFRLAR